MTEAAQQLWIDLHPGEGWLEYVDGDLCACVASFDDLSDQIIVSVAIARRLWGMN